MSATEMPGLSRRERQIMDVVYRLGEATAAQVRDGLPEPVGDASVRKLIRILEQKGHLRHRKAGRCHVYIPTVPRAEASHRATRHLLETFFAGSAPRAVAAILDVTRTRMNEADLGDLLERVRRAEARRPRPPRGPTQ